MAEAIDLLVHQFSRVADAQTQTGTSLANLMQHLSQFEARTDGRLTAIEKAVDSLVREVDGIEQSVTGIGSPSEALQEVYGAYREELVTVRAELAQLREQTKPKQAESMLGKVLETPTGRAAAVSIMLGLGSAVAAGVGSLSGQVTTPQQDPAAIVQQIMTEINAAEKRAAKEKRDGTEDDDRGVGKPRPGGEAGGGAGAGPERPGIIEYREPPE